MAFSRRDWTLAGPGWDDELRFAHRSELTDNERDALVSAGETQALLDRAWERRGAGDGSNRRVAVQILADCGHARFDLARATGSSLRAWLGELIRRGTIVLRATAPTAGLATVPVVPPPEPPRGPSARPAESPRRIGSVRWVTAEAWCSDTATLAGATQNYADDELIEIGLDQRQGARHQSLSATVSGDAFAVDWTVQEVLPASQGKHLTPRLSMDAHAGGHTSPRPLTINFITQLEQVAHRSGRSHFTLSLEDDVVQVGGAIRYVAGWGGEVVKLVDQVPADTGGLLDGQLRWPGYRWMKRAGERKLFWDGETWQDLPVSMSLAENNRFSVGFYRRGSDFVCQYGGSWPESFQDWTIDAADKRGRIKDWESNIHVTWTGKFDLKRQDCRSRDQRCCRYSIDAAVRFEREPQYSPGMMIVADGNIRSNDSLLFLGEPRISVAAHEFGHHLGNRDEYSCEGVDKSLNADGAVAGIDPHSIMGQNMSAVKARHFDEIRQVFTRAVANAFGKPYNYWVVAA
jgi:hypothetical protein